nr:hypothetical protein [Treponema sp.]
MVFFDLVKVHALLGKPVEELSKLEKWGLFLSYADDERYSQYIDGLIKSEEGIMNAKSSLCTVSQDEINWVRQNSIFIAQRDRNTIMQNAVKQGLEQGLRQKAVEIAKKMLSMNICDVEKIAEATGLSVAEVESIAEQG